MKTEWQVGIIHSLLQEESGAVELSLIFAPAKNEINAARNTGNV